MTAIPVGEGTLTVLRDGANRLPLSLFSPLQNSEDLPLAVEADSVEIPINAFLYRTRDRCVLVDTGGAGLSPGLGAVQGLLRDLGVAPDQVDTVFCTHLHPDHVGGLMQDGAPAFPKATLMLHKAEPAFWADAPLPEDAPAPVAAGIRGARAVLAAHADRIGLYADGQEIAPGAVARHLPGHTPGHSGLQLGASDDGLLIWGDIVHCAALQLARPETSIAFDADPVQAVETRLRLLEQVIGSGTRIAGGHLPGIGRLLRAAQGAVFIPDTAE